MKLRLVSFLIATLICCHEYSFAQGMAKAQVNRLIVKHTTVDLPVKEIENTLWDETNSTNIATYWNGERAPAGRHFSVKLLWSDSFLYVRFDAAQSEPLVIAREPNLNEKADGLWDRDVCEIFLAPDKNERRKYLEFEVAPTGEWIDVAIDLTSKKRRSDWTYRSDMQTASAIKKDRVLMAIKIPWKAFGKKPSDGDVWFGNVLRCVGKEPGRGYLAWSPTLTKAPNFHLPEKFGEFEFLMR